MYHDSLSADIDECKMTCFESENRICNNTIGSYMCDCKDGYQENELSQDCEGWCYSSCIHFKEGSKLA